MCEILKRPYNQSPIKIPALDDLVETGADLPFLFKMNKVFEALS